MASFLPPMSPQLGTLVEVVSKYQGLQLLGQLDARQILVEAPAETQAPELWGEPCLLQRLVELGAKPEIYWNFMKFPMEIIWEVWGFNGLVERKPRFLPPLFRVFPLKPETNSVIIILDRSYWQGTIGTIFGNFSCKGMNTWWNHFGVDQFFKFKEETQCFLLIFLRVVEKTLPLVDIKGTGVFDGIMDKSTDCLKSNAGTTGDIMGIKGGYKPRVNSKLISSPGGVWTKSGIKQPTFRTTARSWKKKNN